MGNYIGDNNSNYAVARKERRCRICVKKVWKPWTMTGNGGDDTLIAGGKADRLYGNNGTDALYGKAGHDVLYGGNGNDGLFGGGGSDLLYGEIGDDILFDDDSLVNGFGNDTLDGGDGNDSLYAYSGDDILVGGNGNDSLYSGSGSDRLIGKGGNDYLVGFDRGVQFDTLIGGSGADTFLLGDNYHGVFYQRRGHAIIADFQTSQGDVIKISDLSIRLEYSFTYGDYSGAGGGTTDTFLYYRSDLIAVILDVQIDTSHIIGGIFPPI